MDHIERYVSRLRSWSNSALAKLRQRNWKAWLIVAGVLYVIAEAVRAWVSDAGTLFLVWAFRGLWWLAQQPMGFGGLALVAVVAFLIVLSWWETRPRRTPDVTPFVEPISDAERRLVQDIRVVWNRHGKLAVTQLRDLLMKQVHSLERQVFWASLLNPIIEKLNGRIQILERTLDPKGSPRIADVRESFNSMYEAYIGCMRWVAQLQAEDLFDEDGVDHRIKIWRQNHRDMFERLNDLNEDADHKGTMNIFLRWIENPAFRDFIREAETSPEWLKLMEEHGRRVEIPAE